MKKNSRVLCACIGNNDRSPAMAPILMKFLEGTKYAGVIVISAGVHETAGKGGSPSPFTTRACQLIGIDIHDHDKQRTTQFNLHSFDLIVCADNMVAAEILAQGGDPKKVYTIGVIDNWPVSFQADYDLVFEKLLGAMYRVVARYFSEDPED